MAQVRRIHLWKLKSNFSSHHSNWTLAFWPLYLVPPHNCRQLCHVADFPALMEGGVTIKYNGVNLCKLKVETLETSQNWKKRTTQSLGAFLKSKKFPPKNYATISGSLVKDRFMNLLGAWVWREPWHCKELERDWTSSCLAFAIWVQHSRWMSISKWLNPQVVLFMWMFFFFSLEFVLNDVFLSLFCACPLHNIERVFLHWASDTVDGQDPQSVHKVDLPWITISFVLPYWEDFRSVPCCLSFYPQGTMAGVFLVSKAQPPKKLGSFIACSWTSDEFGRLHIYI